MTSKWYKYGFWVLLVFTFVYMYGSVVRLQEYEIQVNEKLPFAIDTGTTTDYKMMNKDEALKWLMDNNAQLVKANRELNK